MTAWAFIWHAVGVFGGVLIGGAVMALLAASAKADLRLDAIRERCRADLAHHVGDEMAALLAAVAERKDLRPRVRSHIGDLLLRWGALRPTTTTNVPGDFTYSRVTYGVDAPPACAKCEENPENYP